MSKYPVLIGGVGLVKGRIKNIGQAMVTVCDEVKPIIEQTHAFDGLPFNEINMVIRWAEHAIEEPEIGPLRKSVKTLDVATTISLSTGKAIENNEQELIVLVKSELNKVCIVVDAGFDKLSQRRQAFD